MIIHKISNKKCVLVGIYLTGRTNIIIHNGNSITDSIVMYISVNKKERVPMYNGMLHGLCVQSDTNDFEIDYFEDGYLKKYTPSN